MNSPVDLIYITFAIMCTCMGVKQYQILLIINIQCK